MGFEPGEVTDEGRGPAFRRGLVHSLTYPSGSAGARGCAPRTQPSREERVRARGCFPAGAGRCPQQPHHRVLTLRGAGGAQGLWEPKTGAS